MIRPHTPPHHRNGFSMITAIVTIVIMATVATMIMSLTGKTVKATTEQYQKEQAALLARSYTELAVMYAIHYDRDTNNNCIQQITSQFGPAGNVYDITTNITYIGNDTLIPAGCANAITPWVTDDNTGFDGTLWLVVDVHVQYRDFDDPETGRFRTFHRRTVQKL